MIRKIALALAATVLFSGDVHAAGFKLGKNAVQKVTVSSKSQLCGLVSNKWQPVTKSGKTYKLNSKASSAYKKACSRLLKKGAFNSLSKLPAIAQIAKSKYGKSSTISAMEVSGTPPVLADIGNIGISMFWKSGVIEALQAQTPNQQQCTDFWLGPNDEDSGGLMACTLTEDVGYAFEPILKSGTSLCYMQNFPTQTVYDNGAISVVNGSLPDGGITKLFSVPSGNNDRLVKINTAVDGGHERTIFIKVSSAGANASAGNQYKAKLWHCGKKSESEPVSVLSSENIVVSLGGLLKTENLGIEQYGSFEATVQGLLTSTGGSIAFDAASERTANIVYRSISDQNRFKTAITIGADGSIKQKFNNIYSGRSSKKVSLSRVGGDTLQDLKFYEGAFKEAASQSGYPDQSFSGAAEYRDSGYRSAPTNTLLSKIEDINFSSDTFFSDIPDVGTIDPALSCSAEADIEINLDMANSAMQAVATVCEANNKQTNNFCRENDTIKAIMQNYQTMCSPS